MRPEKQAVYNRLFFHILNRAARGFIMQIKDPSFGRIEISTVPLPEGFSLAFGTYTASGRVLAAGKFASDPEEADWYRALVLNDDGTDVREIFSGLIPKKRTANGLRWMPYADNKRVLLGDYVLECTPDLDQCASSELIPIEYPAEILSMPGVFMHWSEIIIAPDNEHMCWTTLTFGGCVCYLGKLVRGDGSYHLEDVCIVSTMASYLPDPEHPGCMLPQPLRGGEVKQFVHGGSAVSVVGDSVSISDSVVQHLESEEMEHITNTPGYEETTMLSPDETMGVVMSPRFSRRTNCAVIGLVPQPYAETRIGITNVIYTYCVGDVRRFRKGNVGPALIDIRRSLTEGRAYEGVNLSDPEGNWVYCSPLSWYPDSTRVMWNEVLRTGGGHGAAAPMRLRVARLSDRAPAAPVPAVTTPSPAKIPYAVPVGTPEQKTAFPVTVAGRVSGTLINNKGTDGALNRIDSVYENFSDDGRTFTNGSIHVSTPANMFSGGESILTADLTVTGEHQGEMKLQIVFNMLSAGGPALPVFDAGEDGLPRSRGYSTYDGVTLKVEDMEP